MSDNSDMDTSMRRRRLVLRRSPIPPITAGSAGAATTGVTDEMVSSFLPRGSNMPRSSTSASMAPPVRRIEVTRGSISVDRAPFGGAEFHRWMRSLGVYDIRIWLPRDMSSSDRREACSPPSHVFIVMMYSAPLGGTYWLDAQAQSMDEHYIYYDEYGHKYPLSRDQWRACRYNEAGRTHILEEGWLEVTDYMGQVIAYYKDRVLHITYYLNASSNHQRELMRFVLKRVEEKARHPTRELPSMLMSLADDLVPTFTELFGRSPRVMEANRDVARARAKELYDAYTEFCLANEDALRGLDTGISTELIKDRAESVLASLKSNPLITGLSVRDNVMRVVTAPLPSDGRSRSNGEMSYYDGVRKLVIQIPLTYSRPSIRNRDVGSSMRIHSLERNGSLNTLPSRDSYFWDDGEFCLGNLKHGIDTNIFSGDWDMVVMSLLQGICGSAALRRFSKQYGDARRAAVEAAEGEMLVSEVSAEDG